MIRKRIKEDDTVTLEEDSENFLLASAVEVAKTCEPRELSVACPMRSTFPSLTLTVTAASVATKPCPCLASPLANSSFHHHHL